MRKLIPYILIILFYNCKNSESKIIVTPNIIVQGDDIDIKIKNLEANTLYDVYLQKLIETKDFFILSKATYISDNNGEIDIDKDASLEGDFTGNDSLGLFLHT